MARSHNQWTSLAKVALAMAAVAVLVMGCAQRTTVDPPPTTTSSASATSSPTTSPSNPVTESNPSSPSTQVSESNPATAQPTATGTVRPSATSAPSPSSDPSDSLPPGPSGSGFETALAVSLPDSFGGWSKLESRQEEAWTIAVYSQLTTAQLGEVHASRAPNQTFEQVVADLIGPDAKRVSTGAVCTTRSGIAGCAQQQDGLTVTLTSPNMGTAEVAEALAQLLAALR